MDLVDQPVSEEDERRLKNLATRIMSNGVEVLVKDKSDGKQDQRKLKFMQNTSNKQHSPPKQLLFSSTVATFVNRQHMSALFPMNRLMQHNYIIKTCMTTYTYLTTVVHNKRSAISTFETIVSVVTTESLTNPYATAMPLILPTKTKYMEVKTIHPSTPIKMYVSNLPKIDKRIDSEGDDEFDLIEPSEPLHPPCTSSCTCSHSKTEGLNTLYSNPHNHPVSGTKYGVKNSKYVDLRPTKIDSLEKKTQYPYEYEGIQAPTDRIVEKYTEVINDYLDENNSNLVEKSELLTNEQAPTPPKTHKVTHSKVPDKIKHEKPQKQNKNKVLVADLLKLGSLGIKGLSQLAPVFEKMTGSFIKRTETNKTSTTTTVKPVTKITPYIVNKRLDDEMESKQSNFPIYIPVDLETSESQLVFSNATLHQNLAWAAEHKQPKSHNIPPKIVHESPLVNGGIPISPGEIITANSDVIVGKPAVGGPLTLAASGIKLHNPVNPPPLDSFLSGSEQYFVEEKPLSNQDVRPTKVDDSYDLRPPELPKSKQKPSRIPYHHNHPGQPYSHQSQPLYKVHARLPSLLQQTTENLMKTEHIKTSNVLGNHGRPVFLDYIPSFGEHENNSPIQNHVDHKPANKGNKKEEVPDNSPSSSEIVNTRVPNNGKIDSSNSESVNKPFLVDMQPSRVANVLIPHGSATALVYAGSSEPHKSGDYVDDPLPYQEPGYFGSFSIDAPQMTNVHNSPPITRPNVRPSETFIPHTPSPFKDQPIRNDLKYKWKGNNRPINFNKLPPPTSNQESHVQVGPKITTYNPDFYRLNNGDFEKYNTVRNKHKDDKEIIDKEYENYLAVPPPPPKMHHNQESNHDNNKPYNQRPIVHTKPVQDMKVFLNIQHPIPKAPSHDSLLPSKVTSEIYYAAQAPNSKPSPTYTFHISPSPSIYNGPYDMPNSSSKVSNNNVGQTSNSFTVVSSPNFSNKSIYTNNINDKDNTYSVTLNTATNVASNVGETSQVIGTSIPVSVDNTVNKDIPISTNFAIRVEDEASLYANHDVQNNSQSKPEQETKVDMDIVGQNHYKLNSFNNPNIPASVNSHANFPMVHEETTPSNKDVKPVTENIDDIKNDLKRPGKVIPNIPTNSHGWYSSVLNGQNKINNIKVEVTTRKIIPLTYDYKTGNIPDFGQKITGVGIPPSEFWSQNQKTTSDKSNYNIGKPFTRPEVTERSISSIPPFTSKPFNLGYIPSYFDGAKQPAYDIPIRDNSDETTTITTRPATNKIKPVYETSEEVYDGGEETDNNDGEVSQESMKIPVVASSSEERVTSEVSNPTDKFAQLHDEVVSTPKDTQTEKTIQFVEFDPGTQTEKPFRNSNLTTFQSNTIKPVYHNLKPRPFTINSATILDHQLHQPHWQINQLMVHLNNTNVSYEDNFDLNLGEEITSSSAKPINQNVSQSIKEYEQKYKRPQRPIYGLNRANDSNIITSIVHINDKHPLIVEESPLKSTSLLPNSSEIMDLSPPPPTMDYNFKPSTNDEMIMGMSPPPARTQPPRLPPRISSTSRPIYPIRTPPPYRNKHKTLPPRITVLTTQKPVRRPINREEISTYRPTYVRPVYNKEQPSSQLLPPSRDLPSKVIPNELPSAKVSSINTIPTVVFPMATPVSSGWLTSSGFDFSSSFEFSPSSVHFPEVVQPTNIPDRPESTTSIENSFSYEISSSSEQIKEMSSEQPVTDEQYSYSQDINKEFITQQPISSQENISESSHEVTTDKNRYGTIGNKNRTRKPYPIRNDDKKSNSSKYKLPSKPTSIIRPTRTLSRPDILYPTRTTSTRKIVRPDPTRFPSIVQSYIESSESSLDEEFIKPTKVLKESVTLTSLLERTSVNEILDSKFTPNLEDRKTIVQQTHHAGNEIKISDEIVPTKTEFKTTVVTLTKTLSEPPKTVSSIGYVNLTHTLTVTHTKTSLVSQSEGAITQTLVLTNTHTSTIVDVVTEIQTQVLPTTIVETVTKHIPVPLVEPTPVQNILSKTQVPLDDVTMSSEEKENFIVKDETTENIQKIDTDSESDSDTFFVVMNKSQNGGKIPSVTTDIDTEEFDITRNEQVNSNGVSQVLFGEILLAGTPYLETTNVANPIGGGYSKECQPDCKASRNERCQRIDGMMKCVCRPGFARMFPDRPCKPTYTYSVKLALGSQAYQRLEYHDNLADNSSKEYHALAVATHEGINRMIMQSDLRDVYHGVHITGFQPVDMKGEYQGVINEFYVQLSDNAHENRLQEVIEKYLRHNNYSLGGTDVYAAGELVDRLDVSDFDECMSVQFHDCSEHAQCFNLRGTYTCSCLEGFADLSVNSLYPGRICSAEPVGCERCNYHGACYSRDDSRTLCECFPWYAGSTCHINLKVVLISLVVMGALLTIVLAVCAIVACRRPRPPPRSIVTCIQSMPSLHQSAMPSKQHADRRALISDRTDSGDASSVQNASLPYMPAKRPSSRGKKVMSDPPSHDPPPIPAPAVMIPRARLHPHHDSRENISRKKSLELSSEAKLISYLESGAVNNNDEMRRKHSMESSYSAQKDRHLNKQGALVSAGFKVSTTIRPDEGGMKEDRDDLSSVNKNDLEAELHFDSLRKSYSQEDLSEWTDAERRIGELTLSEARSVGGTLPASTGRAASSTRMTHQEANTMAERDLGSTFLLPHVHLYKPDLTSDVSEFDSL